MWYKNYSVNYHVTDTSGKSRPADRVDMRLRAVEDAFAEPDPRRHERQQPRLIIGNGEAVNATVFFGSHS